jgi:hypothetical protein
LRSVGEVRAETRAPPPPPGVGWGGRHWRGRARRATSAPGRTADPSWRGTAAYGWTRRCRSRRARLLPAGTAITGCSSPPAFTRLGTRFVPEAVLRLRITGNRLAAAPMPPRQQPAAERVVTPPAGYHWPPTSSHSAGLGEVEAGSSRQPPRGVRRHAGPARGTPGKNSSSGGKSRANAAPHDNPHHISGRSYQPAVGGYGEPHRPTTNSKTRFCAPQQAAHELGQISSGLALTITWMWWRRARRLLAGTSPAIAAVSTESPRARGPRERQSTVSSAETTGQRCAENVFDARSDGR